MVDARDDEEYPRALNIEMSRRISVCESHLCPALLEPAQPEDDGPLVLLHHLHSLGSYQGNSDCVETEIEQQSV